MIKLYNVMMVFNEAGWGWKVRRVLTFTLFIFLTATATAQKINGQWRGYFNSNGDIVLTGAENTEYVLELEVNGSEITGFSYSYFQDRRYYVICSLSGTYYKSTNSMTVTETARIKGLTPPDWTDCLQTHILTYEKETGSEELKGRWVTAAGQVGECGKGLTTLTRRTLSKDLSSYNKPRPGTTPFSSQKPVTRQPLSPPKKAVQPPVAKTEKPKQKPAVTPKTTVPAKPAPPPPLAQVKPLERTTPELANPEKEKPAPQSGIKVQPHTFEKRSAEVVKTIEISNPTFKVDLYDNGDIDGDSVSLFYNNRLVLSHKKLTDKPLSLSLDAADNSTNELTMYAENLGTIPPNTAVMIVMDGTKRYEVRIASDLKKSGTIRFVYKPDLSKTQPAN